MGTALSEAERARRRQFVIDGKAASALGISMEAYHARHKALGVRAPVMYGTVAGGFMCVIARLAARPFMSWSDTTPAPNVGTESSSDADRGGMKRVMRQSQQNTQGLDAPHGGEQFPVNESCAAPQFAPRGSFCSMESSRPKQIGGPAHAGPRQIARPKGGGSGGLRAHRHEVSDAVM